ncbi:MAG: HD domain-containing protein [Calothrix sp. SM1_7_51]|nr:HD domain-containing protein [Calothrix sp. SM1_7_51]
MNTSIQNIMRLLTSKGARLYGEEGVTQLEHALQCATLAQEAALSNEMIVACLLHDLGHLIHNLGDDAASQGIDDSHEYRAIPLLSRLFNSAVTEPIRLHVCAKRYLCAVDSEYWAKLSPASLHSLKLQGGIFSLEEANAFIHTPYSEDAVKLRIFDDQAKVVNKKTPDLSYFTKYLVACLK